MQKGPLIAEKVEWLQRKKRDLSDEPQPPSLDEKVHREVLVLASLAGPSNQTGTFPWPEFVT